MILLIDAGNSRCKWALLESGRWLQQGAASHDEWEALRATLQALPRPARMLVANVAGEAVAQRLRELAAAWACPVRFAATRAAQCGVRNLYAQPAQLGVDRWLALLAAWQRERRACLVVNCGTATTVDALSDDGEFLGGLILPGLALMRQSLAQGTAQLGLQAGELQDFPRNTADAIHSGAMRATIGAIQQQHARLLARGPVRCLLSGGAAGEIEAHLGLPCERVDNLVLHGLHLTEQETEA
ncbi:MAG TPA: type III pantothenate kinase [Gallionellaceae bacterium]|nr:type III pantothenate kinase [Gallionellaceae bacterium]